MKPDFKMCRVCNMALHKNELELYDTGTCNRCYNGSKGSTEKCTECDKFLLQPEMWWGPRVCGYCWSV